MVGILLVSHGRLAEAFLGVTTDILGQTDGIEAVCLPYPTNETEVLDAIKRARKNTDQGDGLLILTDMFGGTPCNICFSLLEDDRIEVLTGMNLPMILKVVSARMDTDLPDLARVGMDCGRENIYLAREILKQQTTGD